LQSRPQFDIFAKFTFSFAKLSKLQTLNAKPLDTSFGAFWQITQMQTSNAKPLEMLTHLRGQRAERLLDLLRPCLDAKTFLISLL